MLVATITRRLRRRAQREILLGRVERPVQRDDLDAARDLLLQLRDRAPNLRRAGQEAEHLAVGRGQQVDRRVGHRLPGVIGDLDRMRPAGHVDHRAAVEKRRHRLRLERRRHDDDAQVVARAPRLPRQRDREIGVHAALVKLVEDDGRKPDSSGSLCRRAVSTPSVTTSRRVCGAEAAIEPHLPADLARRASSRARRRSARRSRARRRAAAAAG